MLVLTRKEGTSLHFTVGTTEFTLTVNRVQGDRVQVGIDAPQEVRVRRGEIPPLVVIPGDILPPDVLAAA